MANPSGHGSGSHRVAGRRRREPAGVGRFAAPAEGGQWPALSRLHKARARSRELDAPLPAGAPRVAVIGLGNVHAHDGAFGPLVAKVLAAEFEFPVGVSAVDAGTPGADLAPLAGDADAIVVVEAIPLDAPAGTIRLFRRHELPRRTAAAALARTRENAPLRESGESGDSPHEFLLVAASPGSLEAGIGLTPPLADAVGSAIGQVLVELERLGVPLLRRSSPALPDLWWEQPELVQSR